MIRKNAFLSLLLFGGFFVACKDKPAGEKVVKSAPVVFSKEAEAYLVKPQGDTIKYLEIEIADDDYQRETGLMYRHKMAEEQAMLFIFENEEPRAFYMKNTYIPLDIIFLNHNNKIIKIARNAKPQSLETILSEAPAQYVLEINAGLADQWNLQKGDSLVVKME
ncbi:MAG: DUF192 domain-containing protein [Salinimicrobium sp.]